MDTVTPLNIHPLLDPTPDLIDRRNLSPPSPWILHRMRSVEYHQARVHRQLPVHSRRLPPARRDRSHCHALWDPSIWRRPGASQKYNRRAHRSAHYRNLTHLRRVNSPDEVLSLYLHRDRSLCRCGDVRCPSPVVPPHRRKRRHPWSEEAQCLVPDDLSRRLGRLVRLLSLQRTLWSGRVLFLPICSCSMFHQLRNFLSLLSLLRLLSSRRTRPLALPALWPLLVRRLILPHRGSQRASALAHYPCLLLHRAIHCPPNRRTRRHNR